MKHVIEVENIKCAGCMKTIVSSLLKIDGVETVHIDKDIETVTVEGTAGYSLVVEALSKLGYPEKGNNNVLKKTVSYVSCAIGKIG
ncbi:MAG: heavy-metal-associated domain-containing protein [Candidatus Kapabacteria bacterium]|nr:heavy-metal-associated domain-containing protein [Candidatus Kapabacteria bacterium]